MNNKRGAYQICVIALKKVPSTDKYYHVNNFYFYFYFILLYYNIN